ncbi:MAG TPA: hypothetical protein VFH61_11935, partial [Thermoleophilia bacterium]|nr:hypothetical protein [Thermoleophilia bacterium]
SRRLKSGVYEAAKLSAIQAKGGSQLFFNITETKCEAFEAWLEDVFAPIGDRAWDAVPTPIPSLPAGSADRVVAATVAQFESQPEVTPQEVQAFAIDLYDETLRQMFQDAKDRAERMVRKMHDQTVEGGWDDAFAQFVNDLATYPSAILKGPILTRTKRLAWQDGEVVVQEDVVPTWCCVDPMNFYPGPNARNVNESYICERIDFDRRKLAEMRGVEGWNPSALNAVLGSAGTPAPDAMTGEDIEKAALEDRDATRNQGLPDSTLQAVEFWGSVQGRVLTEWGMKGIQDQDAFYEVTCVLIGDVVVRAVLNPDPLGRRPYYVTSFVKNRNSLWGLKSLPEKMEDCQEGVNGAQRNLLNNLAIASGPQVVADIDSISPSHAPNLTQMWPWKVWPYRSSKTQGRVPFTFFQPQSNSAELLEVAEYFEKKSDDRTLIPRYVYGNEDMSGAGATASGLSMLMNAAARGLKRVIKNIDRDVLRPAIDRLYTWDMRYLDDDSLKGDVQIVPRGALAMLVREQTQLRRQEFLAMTNNPTDLQIVGIQGRAALLREVAKGLDIPVEDVVPDAEELQRRTQMQLDEQQAEEPVETR